VWGRLSGRVKPESRKCDKMRHNRIILNIRPCASVSKTLFVCVGGLISGVVMFGRLHATRKGGYIRVGLYSEGGLICRILLIK